MFIFSQSLQCGIVFNVHEINSFVVLRTLVAEYEKTVTQAIGKIIKLRAHYLWFQNRKIEHYCN